MKVVVIALFLVYVSGNPDSTQQHLKPGSLQLARLGTEHFKQGENPMGRVVELIEGLKAKIEQDGKAEQKLYDKFACWCEKTTARKAGDIEAGKLKIEELQQLINELSGKGGTLGAEVEQLKKDIAANIEATKEATEIREKENAAYLEERTETEQCIGALEHAVKVLTGAGTGGAAALQEGDVISVAVGVKEALRMANKDSMTPEEMSTVQRFVENPMAFYGGKAQPRFSGAQIAAHQQNPFGDYAPASTVIQGILKEMYDGFTSSLEEGNAEEATKQKDFEALMATKKAELDSLQSTLGLKELSDAEAAKLKADSKAELEATKTQLAEDEKFFEETKVACKNKAMDWAERSRLRTEEIAGINKAIEILSSEDAKATFESAHTTFLQVSVSDDAAHLRRAKTAAQQRRDQAYDVLFGLAKSHRSLRLASLAASLRVAQIPDGGAMASFAPVITSIDKMIGDLREEEQEDIEHRDWCEANENKLGNQKEDLQYKIGQSEGEIERLDSKHTKLGEEVELAAKEILATEEEMQEALDTRNGESEDFKKALKDDSDAVALLAQAIESLTAFYNNNKLPLGLLAKKGHEPEYTHNPDVAPETPGFEKPYGGASSESTGIVAILKMLKEDLEREMAEAKKAEAQAAADFAATRSTALASLNAQKAKKTDLETQQAELDERINGVEKDISAHKDQHTAKEEEMKALAPNCEWLKTAFDKRREARKSEIDGLIQAKATLAGAGEESLGMIMIRQARNSHGFLAKA